MILAATIMCLHIDRCFIGLDVAGCQQLAHALTIERIVISVFANDRVDDDAVRHQALVDDPCGYRSGGYALLLALLAGALLTLGDLDEILGWLHVENFADFVADHLRVSAAVAALALLRHAGNDLLHA